jgi:hypothetical protein
MLAQVDMKALLQTSSTSFAQLYHLFQQLCMQKSEKVRVKCLYERLKRNNIFAGCYLFKRNSWGKENV